MAEKFNYSDLEALAYALPEDIQRKKDFGDFDGALKLIDSWLERDINKELKRKLRVEKEILKLLPEDFPYTFEEALAEVRKVLPDMSEEEFRSLQEKGRIDWIYVNGQERFFDRVAETLVDAHAMEQRSNYLLGKTKAPGEELPLSENTKMVRGSAKAVQEKGEDSWKFRIRTTFRLTDEAFHPGHIRIWLPVPKPSEQIHDIKIISVSEDKYILAPEDAPQRTICFDEDLKENKEFSVEYEWVCTAKYADTWTPGAERKPIYTENSPAPSAEDLAEQLPHIQFTPYMRALAEELTEGIEDDLEKARAFYDYITKKVTYSYMRTYFTCEELSEYAAIGHKGDCGIQALMFITLCRIAGIPARWQSSLQTRGDMAGCHDWAQFYIKGFGWLFCDPSYGGGAYDAGDENRRRFYFGNLDSFRMPANSAFQKNFTPEPKFLRLDPYDNQIGEAEYDDEKITGEMFHTRRDITLKEQM